MFFSWVQWAGGVGISRVTVVVIVVVVVVGPEGRVGAEQIGLGLFVGTNLS